MDSPEDLKPPGPPELLLAIPDRKAAWWCWPLVFFALIPFSWFFETGSGDAQGDFTEGNDQSDLAMLKMQSQVVIATSLLDPASAREALDELSEAVINDYSVAALALLECFVQSDSPGAVTLLERFSKSVPRELASATGKAVAEGVDEAERDQLRSYLGWFADLARGPERSSPPFNESIRTRAVIVLGTMSLMLTGAVLGILAGGLLLIFHLRRLNSGESSNAFDPARRQGGLLLECFALYLGVMTAGAFLSAYLYEPLSVISYVAAVIVPLL